MSMAERYRMARFAARPVVIASAFALFAGSTAMAQLAGDCTGLGGCAGGIKPGGVENRPTDQAETRSGKSSEVKSAADALPPPSRKLARKSTASPKAKTGKDTGARSTRKPVGSKQD